MNMATNINLNGEDFLLNELLEKLVKKYDMEQVFCFAKNTVNTITSGCFLGNAHNFNCHYFLLIITDGTSNITHHVQEFANNNFDCGKVTIIVHARETVKDALQKKNIFFSNAVGGGQLLYAKNGLMLKQEVSIDEATTIEKELKAMHRYMHRYELAEIFRDCALDCINKDHYKAALFLLHQSMEQCCKALLNVYLDYKPDIHRLGRLIDLTLCFSDEPYALFPRRTEEEKRLFTVLQNSYTQARYNDSFKVTAVDVNLIYNQVIEFLYVTKDLCLLKMPQLKVEEPENILIKDQVA